MKKRIVVITDCIDVAAGELRATLVSELDKLGAHDVEVEPIIAAKEFSILNGDFLARLIAESYIPEMLTILAVINPLDTSSSHRARIAIRLNNGIKLVGANTGVFSLLIKEFGITEVVETNPIGLKGDNFISFGGKYVHAPITAQLAFTDDISTIRHDLFSEDKVVVHNYHNGTVVHIDNFGVAKILIETPFPGKVQGTKFEIRKNNVVIGVATYCDSMKELADGELAYYKGSSFGLMELGIVRELHTANTLGIAIGDTLDIAPSEGSHE